MEPSHGIPKSILDRKTADLTSKVPIKQQVHKRPLTRDSPRTDNKSAASPVLSRKGDRSNGWFDEDEERDYDDVNEMLLKLGCYVDDDHSLRSAADSHKGKTRLTSNLIEVVPSGESLHN